ncbi:adiponectin receptor protein 1-like isoform X2 [Pelodiscus sinensis]|uniref:adiponectin receptor protein 1-like isoform X2 n=1 Tax=Pelodiscus sinensis TaxID=13735 RepID=UPI003F6AAC39
MQPLLGEDARQGAEVGAEPAGWGDAAEWGAEEPDDVDPVRVLTLPLQAQQAMGRMEEFVIKVWEGRWKVIPHDVLPDWLKDNDFLLHGHRPPMPSFRACFRSIFRLHTETGNIWTHLIGFIFFLALGIGYMFSPNMNYVAPVQERVVFGTFFLGANLCLCFSWLFHTVYCHSERVSRAFSKLDYSGITLLIVGSFVPWLYYSFYCSPQPQLIYLVIVCALGITAITVSQSDRFSTPQYRAVRAGVFLGLGLSGMVPTLHFLLVEGLARAARTGQIGWLFLMALLYILGAALYAARVPERFFPVPLPPDLPRAGGGRRLRPSPRGLPAPGLPLLAGGHLQPEHRAVSPLPRGARPHPHARPPDPTHRPWPSTCSCPGGVASEATQGVLPLRGVASGTKHPIAALDSGPDTPTNPVLQQLITGQSAGPQVTTSPLAHQEGGLGHRPTNDRVVMS